MQHLEVSGAVRPLKWSLGVKWLKWQDKATVFKVEERHAVSLPYCAAHHLISATRNKLFYLHSCKNLKS